MSNDAVETSQPTLAQRKEKLIREGAAFRAAMRASRTVVNQNLHADVMARSVVSHVTGTAYAAVGNLFKVNGANLQTLLPVIFKGASLIMRARLLRPMLKTTVIVGIVGAGAYYWFSRKKPVRNVN